jgi:hypothetical protein
MKNLLVLFAALLLMGCTDNNQGQTTANPSTDYIVLQHGAMMMSRGGAMMPMTSNMVMGDGSIGMPNGTYRLKDGTTMKMVEGQRMMMDGHLHSRDDMMPNGTMNGGMMNDGETGHVPPRKQ